MIHYLESTSDINRKYRSVLESNANSVIKTITQLKSLLKRYTWYVGVTSS